MYLNDIFEIIIIFIVYGKYSDFLIIIFVDDIPDMWVDGCPFYIFIYFNIDSYVM